MTPATALADISVSFNSARDRLLLTFPYNELTISLVKALPGRAWHKDRRVWSIPPAALADLERAAARAGISLNMDEAVRRALAGGEARKAELLQLKATTLAEPLDLPTATKLYPYQHGGVRFLMRSLRSFKGALLADDLGLGKSVMALSVVALSPNLKEVLILCPSTLKYTWASEIDKHYPQLDYTVIDGDRDMRRVQWQESTRIKIANYETLVCTCTPERLAKEACPDYPVRLREWDLAVLDEAVFIKSYKAERTKRAKKLSRRYSLALTGLPIENKLEELHSILDFAVPGLLGSGWQFYRRHCITNQWGGVVGYRGMAEIRERIRPHYLRRIKADVLPELPAKVFTECWIELSAAEWRVYDAVREQIRAMVEENPKLKVGNILTEMLRLIQIAADARLVGEDIGESTKTASLKEILRSAGDHKVVAFTQFAQYALLLGAELKAPVLWGDLKPAERSALVADFQAGKHPLLLSTEAGAYGITLTAADIVIHATQPYNPAKLRQREDRLHRIGQSASVQIIDLLAKRTVDEHVRSIIHRKRALAAQVFEEGADELTEQSVTKQDLLALLGGN